MEKGGKRMERAVKMDTSPTCSSSAAVAPAPIYSLHPSRLSNEDILFCVDADVESQVEMKTSGPKGRPTRLDAVKQAILLFVNAKLTISPQHRFSFSFLGQSFAWVRRELTNDVNATTRAVRALTASNSSYGVADLTSLFRVANQEAVKSRAQGRLFRVILIYCRSSTRPQHRWPVSEKLFTMDVMYLHDKPSPENCPQKVYDSLVDALEHVSEYEGYIFESGQGLVRVLFRQMCILLCHPQQRCTQDDLNIPKSIVKKGPAPAEGMANEEGVPMSSQ